jgi:hypothetical protein
MPIPYFQVLGRGVITAIAASHPNNEGYYNQKDAKSYQ